MQISRVLVVYKKSYYELYGYEHRERRFAALQQRHHPLIESMRLSHEENQRTLADIQAALEAVALPYDCLYRGELDSVTEYDLLISVGGDGTFLEVARHAVDLPVLGVNSDPLRSTAFFCAADRSTLRQCLETLVAGSLREVRLTRLQASINGTPLPHYALNDLLVTHVNPAAVSSYTLHLNDCSEAQKSSGIWIATAAGSTAAIRAAGGRVMPLRSRKLQYLVREPYAADGCRYHLLKGLVTAGTPLEIMSKMRRGRLFMDGPHLRCSLELGDMLRVTTDAAPLRVLGLDATRRQRF
ncbi:NAD kinase [Candidatus Entotheonellaceae bacterium PAL068K]